MCDFEVVRIKKLEQDVDRLRDVVRDLIPVMDWAGMRSRDEDDKMEDYIDHVRGNARDALNGTMPCPVSEGSPRK